MKSNSHNETVCVAHVMLHGSNTETGREVSRTCWQLFRGSHLTNVATLFYDDSKGFPVYCFTAFVSKDYEEGGFVKEWEVICTSQGIAGECAASYETVLGFVNAVNGCYQLT